MKIRTLAVWVSLVATAGSLVGCTARYSQSLVGSIPAAAGEEVQSKDTGLSIISIAVDEPISAYEQVSSLLQECKELRRVEIDYRDLSFVVFSIPSVRVTGMCVK